MSRVTYDLSGGRTLRGSSCIGSGAGFGASSVSGCLVEYKLDKPERALVIEYSYGVGAHLGLEYIHVMVVVVVMVQDKQILSTAPPQASWQLAIPLRRQPTLSPTPRRALHFHPLHPEHPASNDHRIWLVATSTTIASLIVPARYPHPLSPPRTSRSSQMRAHTNGLLRRLRPSY